MDAVLARLRDEVARTRAQIEASRRARGVVSPSRADDDVQRDNDAAHTTTTTTATATTLMRAVAAHTSRGTGDSNSGSSDAVSGGGDDKATAAHASSSPPTRSQDDSANNNDDDDGGVAAAVVASPALRKHVPSSGSDVRNDTAAHLVVVPVTATRKEGLLWHLMGSSSSSGSSSSTSSTFARRLVSLAKPSPEWALHYFVVDEASGIAWYEPHSSDSNDDEDKACDTTGTPARARRERRLLGRVPFYCVTCNSRGSRFRRAAVCCPRLLPDDCPQATDATRAYFAIDYVAVGASSSGSGSGSSSNNGGSSEGRHERLALAARTTAARDAWVHFLSKYIALCLPPQPESQQPLTRLPRGAATPMFRSTVIDGEAPVYMCDGTRNSHRRRPHALRRLYAAPDDANELLATCSTGCLVYLTYTPASSSSSSATVYDEGDDVRSACAAVAGQLHVWPDTAAHPRIALPSSARDVAWCPFKRGRAMTATAHNNNNDSEHAVALTACAGQPLQLWDVSDGTLRASYVAHNASGAHCSPYAVAWPTAAAGSYVAAGYGDHEDTRQVRLYDVLVEGSTPVWTYRSPSLSHLSCHRGRRDRVVSALSEGPAGPSSTTALLLCGFRARGGVDVCDTRHRCCAALLRTDDSHNNSTAAAVRGGGGVSSVRVCASQPYAVYAGGRGGDDAVVYCWDVRQPSRALARYVRHAPPTTTTQVCDFVLVHTPRATTRRCGGCTSLVSATTCGGLAVFDSLDTDSNSNNNDNNNNEKSIGNSHDDGVLLAALSPSTLYTPSRRVAVDVGVTSGVAALGDGCVAAVLGARTHVFDAPRTPHTVHTRAAAPRRGDADSDDDGAAMATWRCAAGSKRTRAPMSDTDDSSDDDDDKKKSSGSGSYADFANVTVLSLAS